MTDQHPITPPPELELQWEEDWLDLKVKHKEFGPYMADRGAQWGADQELEACCKWLITCGLPARVHSLRAARRPKPPSLKEQAIEDLEQIDGHAVDQLSAYVIHGDLKRRVSNIRRALEALPDD